MAHLVFLPVLNNCTHKGTAASPEMAEKGSVVKPGPVLILGTACWREKTDPFDFHIIPSSQHAFTRFNKNVIKMEKTAASFGIVKEQKPSALETNTVLSY